MKTFGQRLNTIRYLTGLSRQQLNLLAFGVANATNISRLEDGTVANPRPQTIERLAAAVNVSAHWLRTGRLADNENIVRTIGVGGRIRLEREIQGLSARELAKRSGLGESAENVRRIERADCHPTRATLQRIAEALQVQWSMLAYGR